MARHRPVVAHGQGVVSGRIGTEQRVPQVVLATDDLVGHALERGQLADHRQQLGQVGFDRRSDHPERAWLAAETTALREASRMEESRPTPHQVDPSGPAHST